MGVYFAPLEGLTDSIYRTLHSQYFGGVDKYFTPFLSPTIHRSLTPREARELPPADTLSVPVVPQLLTKVPADFLWMANAAKDLGYTEVNLNLGCPSGTVVAKGKGAGMLKEPTALDAFLAEIFRGTSLPISLKTRLGLENPEEFPALLEIFNRYPVKELILHPRARRQFYDGVPDIKWLAYCVQHSRAPVCYNGNLCTKSAVSQFSQTPNVMVGRGLIADPGMLIPDGTSAAALERFLAELLEAYLIHFGGSRNAMFRLKEHWRYLLCKFENPEKLGKRLRKTTDLAEYRQIVREIFATLPMKPETTPDW